MKYEFQECIGARFRRLSRMIDLEFRKRLADYDITENQMTILFVLSKKGEIEQGKIGNILALQRSTMSRNVKLLEVQKLILKSTDYRPTITLTKKGTQLVGKLTPIWESIMDDFMEKLGTKTMKCLTDFEKKLS